jgi:hypothetical protein
MLITYYQVRAQGWHSATSSADNNVDAVAKKSQITVGRAKSMSEG